jgi:pyrroloquinoline quinone (PQQ) biosynthesis protein C
MISNALRTDIESWASRKDEHALFRLAQSGELTKTMVTRYVTNVTFLVRQTPGHLKTARDCASVAGDEELAEYFGHKLGEETGHAEWGDADLVSLTRMNTAPVTVNVTPSIEALDRFLTEAIERDPALYLPYMAFAEYVTVLVGPELLANIESRCGVPRTAMTVIDNHIELDRDHAEEGFGVIDDLVKDPRKLGIMRAALAQVTRFFDAFCEEVVTDTEVERDGQVSAA